MNLTPSKISYAPGEKLLFTPSEFTVLTLEFMCMKSQVETTRAAWKSDLQHMFEFCSLRSVGNEILVDLRDESLMRLKVKVIDNRAPRSSNRMLCTLKKFIKFLIVDKKLMAHNYLATIEGHKVDREDSPYVALTDSEVIAMINQPDQTTFDGASKRMAMILSFYLGLRCAEVCSIRHNSLKDGVLKIKGKGSRVRMIPLSETLLIEIENYQVMSLGYWGELSPHDPLITTKEAHGTKGFGTSMVQSNEALLGRLGKNEVDKSTIWRWFKSIAKECGITKKISPHCARATAITKALDNGVSLREVSILAGHKSIETTVIYDKRRGVAAKVAVDGIKY